MVSSTLFSHGFNFLRDILGDLLDGILAISINEIHEKVCLAVVDRFRVSVQPCLRRCRESEVALFSVLVAWHNSMELNLGKVLFATHTSAACGGLGSLSLGRRNQAAHLAEISYALARCLLGLAEPGS
jgi:hypothetical protein